MDPAADKKNFGDRLRRARLMRGLTLREVAQELNTRGQSLSHASLQKYEKGLMGPDSTTLLALARVFQLDPGFFFRQKHVELGAIQFRKLTKFPKRDVDRVCEEAADYFEKYLQIEEILEIGAAPLPVADLSQIPIDDEQRLGQRAEAAGEMLRQEWKLGEVPLANVHELIEEHGVKVMEVQADEAFNGFSGWADNRIPVIVLAEWLAADLPRKRLTALHELGHLVMKLPESLPHKLKESLCYRFAGAVLLPANGRANMSVALAIGLGFMVYHELSGENEHQAEAIREQLQNFQRKPNQANAAFLGAAIGQGFNCTDSVTLALIQLLESKATE